MRQQQKYLRRWNCLKKKDLLREAVANWYYKIDLSLFDNEKLREKQKELDNLAYHLHQYNVFVRARNLGIKFGPSDVSIEDLNIFSVIEEKINEIRDKERSKDGRKTTAHI